MAVEHNNNRLLEEIHGKDSVRDVALVAEDCRISRKLLEHFLPDVLPAIKKIVFVKNGREGIDKISGELKGKVAIIITDIEMTEMNGIDMAKNLKAENDDLSVLEDMRHVPIVVNSANKNYVLPSEKEYHEWWQLNRTGIVDSFMTKPFGVEQLEAAIFRAVCMVRARISKEAQAV